jgi:hypothetical protein
MQLHLRFALLTVAVSVGLFATMLVFLELGRRRGIRATAKRGPDARVGVGVIDSAVYGLLGLLIGFTFSGATTRFDQRRQLVADEANAAGTAWQRVALLPVEQQAPIHDRFRRYLDALLGWYEQGPGYTDTIHEPALVTRAQDELWAQSVTVCLTASGEKARMLLLPALNELFGTVEKERIARRMHPPPIIWIMLCGTALAAALFAGYALSSATTRNHMFSVGFAACVSLATYVVIELEYPRLGLIRATSIDQTLVELRATWEEAAAPARRDSTYVAPGS